MRQPRRLGAFLGLLLLAGCATTAPPRLNPRAASFPPPRFEPLVPAETAISGGARVFWLEDHDVPLVRVYLAFRGGSVYDTPEKEGLAAVTAKVWRTGGAGDMTPEAFDEALESKGVELSLSMGRETGWVSLSVLPDDLDEGLRLLALLLREPSFRADRVGWAVRQVAEEIRREADDPEALAFRELRRALYSGHPRGEVPTLETVGRVKRADVVAFHQRLTWEGEWVLGVVGDFESAALRRTLEGLLGWLPSAGQGFPPVPPPPPPEPRTVVLRKELPQSTLIWARLGPGRTDRAFYPLEIADYLVGAAGLQSRLVQDIRSDRGLAYSVGSFYQALPEFGVLGARASTRTDATAEVLGLLSQVLAEAASEGFTARDVEQAKEALVNRHVFRHEDMATAVRDRMGLVLDRLPLDLPARYPAEIEAVTAEEVSEAARRHYTRGAGVTVVVGDVDTYELIRKEVDPVEVISRP